MPAHRRYVSGQKCTSGRAARDWPSVVPPKDTTASKLTKEERKQRRNEGLLNDEDQNLDQQLVEHMRKNLTSEKSKDGLHAGLFP